MSWPTKFHPFRRPVREANPIEKEGEDAFPRFHKEALRPALPFHKPVVGFAVPPSTSR